MGQGHLGWKSRVRAGTLPTGNVGALGQRGCDRERLDTGREGNLWSRDSRCELRATGKEKSGCILTNRVEDKFGNDRSRQMKTK